MARGDVAMVVTYSLTCLTLLTGLTAEGSVLPKPENHVSRSPPRERAVNQQLNTSALNTALAFEPYRHLATRTTAEPGVQQPHNILFSPLGLASALALLSRVSGSQSRSQVLEALGLAANPTEQSVEATMSALTELQHGLALQEPVGGAGPGTGTPGLGPGGAEGGNGTEDGVDPGGQLRVWSSLHVDGRASLDYDSFLSRPHHGGPSNATFDTLMEDLDTSDKLELNNYVYFKGRQPFERRHTALRSFQLNTTASVEVSMMFRDDEVMMLYDTNCSATVVRLASSPRLASLLLLPKTQLQPLEDCLSDRRMSFWLSNLKPGRAEIRFPKLRLRRSNRLEDLLRNSGVSAVFSDSADFSGISQKMLKLVKAPHEVLLEVEETKSEDGGRADTMLDFSVPPRITFNRPFMLIVYDKLTGLVLLMGRVLDPTDL